MSKEPKRNVYVGHRYVPKIMDEWDKNISYEGLSVVTYEGGSYTSKKHVPLGIDINNKEYWSMTGNYDAQTEHYRQEVLNYKDDLTNQLNVLDGNISNSLNIIDGNIDMIKNNIDSVLINVMFPPSHLVGLKGDGSDESSKLQNIIDSLNSGDTIYFPTPDVKYYMKQSIEIEKHGINIIGTSLYPNNGSIIEFDGVNGFIRSGSYINIENIHIKGVNRKNEMDIDIKNNIFGTIGLKNSYKNSQGVGTSGGGKTKNVSITGFNIGYSTFPESIGTWSGAYRENTDLYILNNNIGIIVLDGGTHEKFYGGRLEGNNIHGIYTDVRNNQYNNIEIIGMTLEKNGNRSGSFNNSEWDNENYGLYVGRDSSIKFNNSYFEIMTIFTQEKGKVFINESHIHHNVRMFGYGVIKEVNSSSGFINSKKYGGELLDNLTLENCTGKKLNPDHARIEIKSNENDVVRINFDQISLRSLPVKYLNKVKFSIGYKVNSGFNAENFGIRTSISLHAIEGSNDFMNIDLNYPIRFLQPQRVGEYERIEFYFNIRKSEEYLDVKKLLSNIKVTITFTKSNEVLVSDFRTDNLDVELINPVISLLSDQDFLI